MAASLPSSSSSVQSGVSTSLTAADSSSGRPELLYKFEGGSDDVNRAVLIPESGQSKGIITISSDRSVRVWLLRDSDQYWPSVCHYLGAAATSMCYHHGSRTLFVGTETGMISEFKLAEDLNRLDPVRDYHAHQGRVNEIRFAKENNWVMSAAKDKYFQFHCTESGRRLGGYLCNAMCTSLEYDQQAQYVFIGDYSGQITVCKLDGSGVKFVNTLTGHNGSIQTLTWDGSKGWLFSGSFDATVFIWDIGGRKGTVYELHGHRNKVTAVKYSPRREKLISVGEDTNMVTWDLKVNRIETSDWNESDACQLCNRPFFWNLKAMYDQRQFGLRQHHCRRCGKAVCDSCSTKRTVLPMRGHEFPVRVCEDCFIKVTPEEKVSHADFYDLKAGVRCLDYDESRDLILTVGSDRMVKLWSIKDVI